MEIFQRNSNNNPSQRNRLRWLYGASKIQGAEHFVVPIKGSLEHSAGPLDVSGLQESSREAGQSQIPWLQDSGRAGMEREQDKKQVVRAWFILNLPGASSFLSRAFCSANGMIPLYLAGPLT